MGGSAPWQVRVYDEDGDEIQVTGGVFWDWDDEDENKLRISFKIYKPEGF